jgi:branched-chain amino acid aminotransferase
MTNTNIISLENLEGYIWFNGEYIKWNDAKIHVLTHSLHYGGGVFEGEKSVNGKIFKVEKHTERLFNSAKYMGLDIKFSKEEIINSKYELLKINNLTNAYLRPFAWRSTSALMAKPQNPVTNLIIAAWEPRRKESDQKLNLNISRWIKPAPNMHPVQCKASSLYTMLSIAVAESSSQGFDDAIMLDQNGYISECTTSNIFFIKDKKLTTPKTTNCLNGITRQTVIEIAKSNNIEVIEQDIKLEDIPYFESGFITGTASGLKEIGSIALSQNKVEFNSTEIFAILKNKYDNLVRGNHE